VSAPRAQWHRIGAAESTMTELDKTLNRVLESYASAVLGKDVDAFMRLYDPKVRVFDAWGVWLYDGADAWRVAVEGWLSSLGSESVKVSFADVQSSVGDDMALLSAVVTYAAVSEQGAPLRSMQNRLTWVLRTSGHVRRIVHEHTSAPIGFDDARAILQREPAR
jgi:ketosteroid isomerase-like protein